MKNIDHIYKILLKFKFIILFFILLLSLNNLDNFFTNAKNTSNQLYIDSPDEIYENADFLVSIYVIENNTPHYQIDAIILFNNKTYEITYDYPELNLESPNVENDSNFEIIAMKDGYLSAKKNIKIVNNKVIKPKLLITILNNNVVIKGNTYLSLLVTDEKGIPIENVTVGIQNLVLKNSVDKTDKNGFGQIYIPNDFDEIIILAQKNGYINASEKIWIKSTPIILEKIIQNPYTSVIISIIVLFIIIIYVSKKKQNNKKLMKYKENYQNENISKEKIKASNDKKQRENIQIKEAKIEEIRINKKNYDQKIINLNDQEKLQKRQNIRNKDKWFEGIDEIRDKIDTLTNNIDGINENKWFEGKEFLREKIDKALKKNKK
jgi:hypothetical protein